MRERIAEAGLLLYVATLPWAIAPMSIAAAFCLVAALVAWIGRAPRDWAPVWPAALAWLAAHVMASAWALDPTASFARVSKGLMPLVAVVVGGLAGFPQRRRRAITVLLVSAGLASVFGLVSYAAHGGPAVGRARGAVGHYMTFAGQLMLLACLAAGLLLAGVPRRLGVLAGAVLGLLLVALAFTFTRSAWIGLACGLAVAFAVRRPRALPVLLGGLVMLLLVAPASFRARALSAFDPHHVTNLQRTYMWEAGLRMFHDHPLTGVGLEDLKTVYDRYRVPEATERAGHLHSVPVQIAATMGVVGLAAFAWLMVALFRVPLAGGLRGLRERGFDAGVRLAVLAGLTGFLVAGLFEWNAGDEELLHLLFALTGLAWAARPLRRPEVVAVPEPEPAVAASRA